MSAAQDEVAAILRAAFLECTAAGWRAHDQGTPESAALIIVADGMEPLVQKIATRLVPR